MREFESCEELVEHNWNNLQFPKEYHTAKAIAMRHAVELGPHRWSFSHDKRHYGVGSPLPQTESDINNSLRSIVAPVLLLLAEDDDAASARIAGNRNGELDEPNLKACFKPCILIFLTDPVQSSAGAAANLGSR